jgi:Methyltransferase domain
MGESLTRADRLGPAVGLAYSGGRRVRSRRAATVTDVPWEKHVQISRYRVIISFCCGLCVFCVSLVGLRLYSTGWLQAALRPSTRPPAIIGRSATRPPNPPTQDAPTVDQNAYLINRDAFYRRLPARYVQSRRIEDQAKLLEAYKEDPEGFLEEYEGVQRIFLFDAVIDAKNMTRVGTSGDGGKWVSDPQSLRTGTVVYSFGAGDEISFDAEMAGLYGCEVHCFDPTPSVEHDFARCRPGQPVGKGTFWFHAVGLGPVSLDPDKAYDLVLEDRKCKVKRLDEIAAELGHSHIDILKIDIEGGEMAALTEILTSGALARLSVKQLLVEFHLWGDEHWDSFVKIIGLLRERGYLIFRKEFNPLLSERCAEFCFLGPQ